MSFLSGNFFRFQQRNYEFFGIFSFPSANLTNFAKFLGVKFSQILDIQKWGEKKTLHLYKSLVMFLLSLESSINPKVLSIAQWLISNMHNHR
jgi:hypothetical protein